MLYHLIRDIIKNLAESHVCQTFNGPRIIGLVKSFVRLKKIGVGGGVVFFFHLKEESVTIIMCGMEEMAMKIHYLSNL